MERNGFGEKVQKGSNKRFKKVSGAPKRCRQVQGVYEEVQKGVKRLRFRCKSGQKGSGAPAHRPGPRTAMTNVRGKQQQVFLFTTKPLMKMLELSLEKITKERYYHKICR